MSDFNFNAPQFIDFSSNNLDLSEYGDEYFDMDHEIEVEYIETREDHEIMVNEPLNLSTSKLEKDDMPKMRRSISAGSILLSSDLQQDGTSVLNEAMNSLHLTNNEQNNLNQIELLTMPTKKNVSVPINNNLKPKALSRDAINKIGLPNEKLTRKTSADNLHQKKYISIAEAINKFQFGTPQRFHSQSAKSHFHSNKLTNLANTIPHSPMLATKNRTRNATCVSREEQELKEAEEMKKYQIKAHPINYKIFKTPVLNAKVEKKKPTKPQPFRLTEAHFLKEPEVKKEEVYEFHAKPAPKTTEAKPIIVRRSVMPNTVAKTPTFMKRHKEKLPQVHEKSNNRINVKTVEMSHDGIPKADQKLTKTKIEPFSFEERDKIIQQRKEEKIKKLLEEEKKAREFHAKPISSKVACGTVKIESKVANMLRNGSFPCLPEKNDENVEPNIIQFKARPATVIHKKPFVPKKEEYNYTQINEFQLNTDRRAKKREKFEKMLKEREEQYEKNKMLYEEYMKEREEYEINKARKETVHKANPIKHYKPIEIHPSTKKLTSPRSPLISKTHRQNN